MKIRKLKKGFTLVELVVVIAIIAILSTVSVVGYLGFTKKANVSGDKALVAQLNTILKTNESETGAKPATATEAIQIVAEQGINVDRLKPLTSKYTIAWNSEANEFALLDEKENVVSGTLSKTEHLNWLLTSSDSVVENTTYSTYLMAGYSGKSNLSVKTGLDVGENTNVTSVTYTKADEAKDVILRTNGGTLTVNADTDNVTHYGSSDRVNVTAVEGLKVFAGGEGTKKSPYSIVTGEQALLIENYSGYFKLDADIVVTNEIYMSGKTYVVDLNGHSVTLEYAEGVKPNNGSVFYIGGKKGTLTINDSSEGKTGSVIGSDKTYTNKVTSAVRAGNYGKLTINGGHFIGRSQGTSCIFVMTSMSSGSKATVVINGGEFETKTPSNGIYFVLNHQDSATAGCTITVNGGTFKNYNPGVTVVDPVNARTGKISLGEGCITTSTVDGDVTYYTVTKA